MDNGNYSKDELVDFILKIAYPDESKRRYNDKEKLIKNLELFE